MLSVTTMIKLTAFSIFSKLCYEVSDGLTCTLREVPNTFLINGFFAQTMKWSVIQCFYQAIKISWSYIMRIDYSSRLKWHSFSGQLDITSTDSMNWSKLAHLSLISYLYLSGGRSWSSFYKLIKTWLLCSRMLCIYGRLVENKPGIFLCPAYSIYPACHQTSPPPSPSRHGSVAESQPSCT